MRIFSGSAACQAEGAAAGRDCLVGLRGRHRLSEAELKQIDFEGTERTWPPLQRGKADLQPLAERGLKLCRS